MQRLIATAAEAVAGPVGSLARNPSTYLIRKRWLKAGPARRVRNRFGPRKDSRPYPQGCLRALSLSIKGTKNPGPTGPNRWIFFRLMTAKQGQGPLSAGVQGGRTSRAREPKGVGGARRPVFLKTLDARHPRMCAALLFTYRNLGKRACSERVWVRGVLDGVLGPSEDATPH
jgi:hypothetical protein